MHRNFFLSRLCVSSSLWSGRPAEEMARSMMRLGLRQAELCAEAEGECGYRPGPENSRLFNLLAEVGVAVSALRISGLDRRAKLRAIEEAGKRGIPLVIDRAELLCLPDLVDRLRTYASSAAHAGVHLVLENDDATTCDNAQAQLTLGAILRHPGLRYGYTPRFAAGGRVAPSDEVASLGAGLWLAHLWHHPLDETLVEPGGEANMFASERRLGPRDHRAVDWEEYFRSLNLARFRGLFHLRWRGSEEIEAEETERAIVRSVAFYARLAESIGLGAPPDSD